jgi:hypothetical protein
MCGSPGGPCTRLKTRKKTKTKRHISNDKKKKKMSITLNPYNGQVDEIPRPVEETTGGTSISAEGAFFATSDVSDAVANGEEVEETESEFCTETRVFEDGRRGRRRTEKLPSRPMKESRFFLEAGARDTSSLWREPSVIRWRYSTCADRNIS